MSIISFANTTQALLAGRKTCTRREWSERHAAQFHTGDLVTAYNKNPRNGGKPVAIIQLLGAPKVEGVPPDSDFEAEGFAYMKEHGLTLFGGQDPQLVFHSWKQGDYRDLFVVRFKLVEVLP